MFVNDGSASGIWARVIKGVEKYDNTLFVVSY